MNMLKEYDENKILYLCVKENTDTLPNTNYKNIVQNFKLSFSKKSYS